jgi:hypothetical protein
VPRPSSASNAAGVLCVRAYSAGARLKPERITGRDARRMV